jgi:hypothetical protein
MKLLLENWRRYIAEAPGLDTIWDNLHIDDVFKITGKSCDEGDGKECKTYTTKKLKDLLKNKPIVDILDPKRVKYANPEYPLIVVVNNGEYQYIMDGNHRFANAVKTGKDVKVKELDIEEYNEMFGAQNETPT